jgi:hypothetical protein
MRQAPSVAFAALLVFAPVRAHAQTPTHAWTFGAEVQASVAPSTERGWLGGLTPGISQQTLALRASTALLDVGPWRLSYNASLLPVIRLNAVERGVRVPAPGEALFALQDPAPAWGVGIVPMALGTDLCVAPRLRLEAGIGIGIAGFSRAVPTISARRRNFIAEWDAGASVRVTRTRAVYVSLRSRHLSNGFTAPENLGLDNRLLVLGARTAH